MVRPSQNIDLLLLQSGRELFPHCGCCDLSLRRLTEHAGVNHGMFHYHFKNKDNFLGILLQNMYEEFFLQLQAEVLSPGTPKERLRQTMNLFGRLAREHGPWLGRVWSDAARGEEVAMAFLKKNGSRHMQLIVNLVIEAIQKRELDEIAPMQAFTFLMGAVAAPVLIVPRVMAMGFAPALVQEKMHSTVLSDQGIAERVDRALFALSTPMKEIKHV